MEFLAFLILEEKKIYFEDFFLFIKVTEETIIHLCSRMLHTKQIHF